MAVPSLPSGYDVAHHVSCSRVDCHVTVGFDLEQGHIPRFLVYLHYRTATDPVEWTGIARMDHNETSSTGHDVYREGLHVDVARRSKRTVHLQVRHGALPSNRGVVVRECDRYLRDEAEYFIDVFEECRQPGSPPRWSPDGGDPTRTFISAGAKGTGMSREGSAEDEVLSPEELSEVLATATGATPEEIEQGAEDLALAPPDEATVVGYGDHGPLTDPDE